MPVEVKMPQLGETVTEGTILSWAKQVGDTIEEDEVLVEISTDKVDTEVPSPAAGTLQEILVEEGETVEVGTVIALIATDGEADVGAQGTAPEEEEAPEEEAPEEEAPEEEDVGAQDAAPEEGNGEAPEPESEEEREPARVGAPAGDGDLGPRSGPGEGMGAVLSPVVRKLARENQVDLARIEGSGRGGRITRRDVESFLERREEAPAPEREEVEAPARPAAPVAAEPEEIPTLPGDEVRDLTRLRARIGENMIRSTQTAAHVWTAVEVDYERVERVRQARKEAWKEQEGHSLTYLPFITRATVDALREYPVVNSSLYLGHRKAVFHQKVNMGFGIDLNQEGLIVAVLKDADELGIRGISRGVRELAEKARQGKLEPDDISGSTFTITNPGPFGSFVSAPIINVPNVGILSTETVRKRPTVIEGPHGEDVIAIHHIGYLGFTWDHRAFDGSTAVLFLNHIKEALETWDWEQELT